MDNSLLIKNVLYTKGLYDDVINIIIDYFEKIEFIFNNVLKN